MKRWKQVRWTEAGQVRALLGLPPSDQDTQSPEEYFDALRATGRDDEATQFISQALPRFEAVAWATRTVRDLTPPNVPRPDADALKAALLWLQDPSDTRRRAAYDAASQTDTSAQRLCALAVFFSGGSLAPAHLQPVPAPKEVAGRFAAGAVLVAAGESRDRAAAIASALKLGDALASGEAAHA